VDGRNKSGHDEGGLYARPWRIETHCLSPVMLGTNLSAVMPALVAGIHDLRLCSAKDVDGRDKPGHDEGLYARP
jgi:hypothetical protein